MQNSPSTNHIEFTIEKLNRIHNKNRIAGKKHPEIEKNDMKKTVERRCCDNNDRQRKIKEQVTKD